MGFQDQVADHVKRVPARRWLDYAKYFGRDTQECMTDAVLTMVIVANEIDRKTQGLPWNAPAGATLDRYLDMGLEALQEAIEKLLPEDTGAEGATFREGASGGQLDSGLDADGPGAGVRAEPGSDLQRDGDSAV